MRATYPLGSSPAGTGTEYRLAPLSITTTAVVVLCPCATSGATRLYANAESATTAASVCRTARVIR